MSNIFEGVQVSDMTTQATGFIASFGGYVALLLGILLAFLVIGVLIELLTGKEHIQDDDDDDYDDEFD